MKPKPRDAETTKFFLIFC